MLCYRLVQFTCLSYIKKNGKEWARGIPAQYNHPSSPIIANTVRVCVLTGDGSLGPSLVSWNSCSLPISFLFFSWSLAWDSLKLILETAGVN